MTKLNEQQKREELTSLLIELSTAQDLLKDNKQKSEYYRKLESIYYNVDAENFRHYYSDIFGTLTVIDFTPDGGNLDILAQNMAGIKEGYRAMNQDANGETIHIEKEINKLYDHVNLEIARINYTKRYTNETQSRLSQSDALFQELKKKQQESDEKREAAFQSIQDDAKRAQEEAKSNQAKMQNEYITILGIFAAIVLAFTGGMTFSTSVLEHIAESSIYRIVVIALILGLILFNLMWLLIDFLRDINGKTIRKWWIILLLDGAIILGIVFMYCAYRGQWIQPKTDKEPTKIEQVNETDTQTENAVLNGDGEEKDK